METSREKIADYELRLFELDQAGHFPGKHREKKTLHVKIKNLQKKLRYKHQN